MFNYLKDKEETEEQKTAQSTENTDAQTAPTRETKPEPKAEPEKTDNSGDPNPVNSALEKEINLFELPKDPSPEVEKVTEKGEKTSQKEGQSPGESSETETSEEPEEPQEMDYDAATSSAGVEMATNLVDHVFPKFNAWLNKDGDQADAYEADTKDRKLISQSIQYWFETFKVKLSPKKGVLYTIVLVYGFDFAAGVIVRIQDLFKKWTGKAKKKAQQAAHTRPSGKPYQPQEQQDRQAEKEHEEEPKEPKAEPEEEQHSQEPLTKLDQIMLLPEHKRKVKGYRRCANPECDKFHGENRWHKNKVFCDNNCKMIVLNAKRKEE